MAPYSKRIITTLQACDEAARLLRMAGFEVVNASMRSEAVYYRFPGRKGVIRIASHTGGPSPGLGPVLVRLTFNAERRSMVPDALTVTEDGMHSLVCGGIGRYMIASSGKVKRVGRYWQTEDATTD